MARVTVAGIEAEFLRYKALGEKAIAQLDGAALSIHAIGRGYAHADIVGKHRTATL